MGIIKSYSEFINENTFVDIIKKDREDYVKGEDVTVEFLQEKIKEIIKQTTGNILDLRKLGKITSNFSSFEYLFYDLSYDSDILKGITEINVSGWDTSKVTNMSNVFGTCEHIKKITGLETWDVSGVKNMNDMFWCCKNLTELNISNWDVSKVEDMGSMFDSCENLTELDISNWDVSGVTNICSMFYNCPKLTELNIDKWDVSKVENKEYMFENCTSLEKLPSWYKRT